MSKRLLTIAIAAVECLAVFAQTPTVFDNYFAQAQAYARAFPREKVYLHFDNTSYYQGDTIWFKAYVLTAADNMPSKISKPLYVEFVDQLGNVMDRQIVKLENGEGHGQISLANTFFTGYYEVRAYTKWMLAFGDDPQYFSRTLPVYRKRINNEEQRRSIATYRMDKSMKQRPVEDLKDLNVRFFPEGGHLVEGIPSVVGFETLSEDSGWVNVNGYLLSESGERILPVSTTHDGMGSFTYTPGEKPALVEISYNGKTRRFKLPKAQPAGYGITVNVREESLDVTVSRSAGMTGGDVALFLFSGLTPRTYVPVDFSGSDVRRIKILTADLPGGVVRLALVNSSGEPLLDRFCYVYPKDTLRLSATADNDLYAPFGKAECRLRLTDAADKPVAGARLSVAVRDALDMDYMQYDNNIFTDLLLTSELKGYIHQPGFYFADRSPARRKMLDNLLLIRGWRRYDVQECFGLKPAEPKYLPEPNLNLYGHIDSWYGKAQADIGITVMAHNDSVTVMGSTRADSLGNFVIPLDDFYGKMEALIQTRRDGKKYNRNALVSLFRNFEPPLRRLDWFELNPEWSQPADTVRLDADIEAFEDSLAGDEKILRLGEVVVKAKYRNKRLLQDTEKFERDILGFYNIRQYVDRLRDNGKLVVDDIGYLMHTINDRINREGTLYGVNELRYSANGKEIDQVHLVGCIDMIETAMLYMDYTGMRAFKFSDKDFRVDVDELRDIYTGQVRMDTVSMAGLRKLFVRCAFQMQERWNAGKSYKPTHGIRKTEIQGYSVPAEFYSPQYSEKMLNDGIDDRRRTLYWNPEVVTDENGEAVIECFNSRNTTYMNVSAETVAGGKPASVSFNTYSGR